MHFLPTTESVSAVTLAWRVRDRIKPARVHPMPHKTQIGAGQNMANKEPKSWPLSQEIE
jgi:hypothetical protein